jgi:threonyl-tRNA synthetase
VKRHQALLARDAFFFFCQKVFFKRKKARPVVKDKTVQITYKNQEPIPFQIGTRFSEVLRKIAPTIESEIVALKFNEQLKGLSEEVTESGTIDFLSFSTPEGRDIYRHSSSHIMAQAVKALFPKTQLAIGPPIEDGFYYDFAFERPFTPEDLERVEEKMKEIVEADLPIFRKELKKEEAISLFRKKGEDYKVELIEGISDPIISLFQQGEFIDLCRGPHLPSTKKMKSFKILNSAGAYWRGNEKNAMLQRIYGTSFPNPKGLKDYLTKREEIKRRDHRKIGRDLDLFNIHDESGPGLVLWHPKGALVRKIIEDFWRDEHQKAGYDFVFTPHIAKLDLWKESGHLEFYKENMFSHINVEGSDYQLKPMNCPFHILIYKSHLRSYRDLPIRFAELGTVYRYERSGVLHGLLRVRGFTQDDAHIFCRPDQLEEEINQVLDFTLFVLKTFGFTEYDIYLSTRPEHFVGSPENWEKATLALKSSLEHHGLPFQVDPGEGVFYGPKIDIKIKDVLGRAWQCTTIQVDFNLPERFGIGFIGEDGNEHRPIMVHRALLGSLERFLGVLIENYAGAFPTWLAPIQVMLIPITDQQHPYAQEVHTRLKGEGIRVQTDLRKEKMNLKIREAQLAKTPFMLIMGDREVKENTVSVRKRTGENLGAKGIEEVLKMIQEDIQSRGLT